jgi:GTPase SAR1 family protein
LEGHFKIVVFGNSSEKRKRFLTRYTVNPFGLDTKLTIGEDISSKIVSLDERGFKLGIWAFSDEERFHFKIPMYVRGARGGLFLFDVADKSSIAHIDDWLALIRKEFKVKEEFPIIVVGLRSGAGDEDHREISREEAKNIAKSRGLDGYIECDVDSGENVEEAFEALTRLIIKNSKYT